MTTSNVQSDAVLELSDVSATRTVHTFCRYCMAACGIDVTVQDNRAVKIAPDRQNPYTWQDFCAKGRTAAEVVEHPRRIVAPMKRVGDEYVESTWEEAISDIATRLNRIIDEDGPDAVATYWGNPAGFSGSNLAFLGAFCDAIKTRNRYYCGSMDQAGFHAVATAMYGSQLMSLVSDVERCDYFLVVGGNPAVSTWGWIESVPGGWRKVLDRQRAGAKLVVVDPVRTETADHADLHLAPRPGQDWALLLGMVKVILDEGLEHREDCAEANGVDEIRRLVAEAELADLAARCDIPAAQIELLAREFATAENAVIVTRTGGVLHLAGTVNEWMGQLLNLITGRNDRPGARRFERGYVDALTLFDKMSKPMDHTSRVAGRPMKAGHHGLDELPAEITTPGRGRVRALIIDAGNPVVSGPDRGKLDEAMEQLDLLVAMDMMQRESHRHAHWLLPSPHWLEREDLLAFMSGLHSKPFAQYGQRAVEPPPGTREEWRIFTDLCLAMRKPLFGYRGVNTFVKATRKLSKLLRRPGIEFGPRWIDPLVVASGRRVKWRDLMAHPHGLLLGDGDFGDFRKALKTPDKKVHAAPPEFLTRARELLAQPPVVPPTRYPFQLANRRNRHSMNSYLNELPSLHPGGKTNHVIINAIDAAELEILDGDLVRVSSSVNEVELEAKVTDQPRRGVVIIDHGWGSRIFDPRDGKEPESYGTNRNLLVDPAEIDPLSQTAPMNSSYVRVDRVGA